MREINITIGKDTTDTLVEIGQEQNINYDMHGDWSFLTVIDTLNNYNTFAISHTYNLSGSTPNLSVEKRLSIPHSMIMSNTVSAELRRKRTLAYFNSKTFADLNNKTMQEVVYEVIS
jgi:hypothetical protein